MNDRTKRTLAITIIILIAVVSRLIPHEANVSPLAAMALFGGAYFLNRKWAFFIPVAILFLSDLILQIQFWTGAREFAGFYPGMIFVYASFLLIVLMGMGLGKKINVLTVMGSAVGASVAFFAVTNFGVWVSTGMYPLSLAGLGECFAAAIPFFRGTLLGDLFFTAVIFGSFQFILIGKPEWKPSRVTVTGK